MLGNAGIMIPLPLAVFESIGFIAWFAAFGAYAFLFHASIHGTEHEIPPRKNPTSQSHSKLLGYFFRNYM